MDTALKQRLIGAAVLVALAVIFLPMLVKGPAPDSGVSDVPLKMPDAPGGEMETRELPLAAPGEVPKGGAVGMDATPVDRPQPAAAAPDAGAAPPADPSATPPADAAQALPPTAAGGDYAVHFGAYATQKGADQVVALAKNAGLPAYSETTTVNGKSAFRVRIGPYANRAEAESVRLKALEVRSDVPVRVVALDAETTAPAATEPPKPTPAEPAKPAEPQTVAARPEPKPETKPAPPASKPAASKPAASAPASSAPAASAPVASAPKPTPAPAPKPAAPKPVPTPAAAKVGFAVQVGAFSDAVQAGAMREKLRAAGFPAFTDTVTTDKGKLTRVRVGPALDRAAADQLKAQIQARVGVDGIVRPYP